LEIYPTKILLTEIRQRSPNTSGVLSDAVMQQIEDCLKQVLEIP
jgi:hypothetical protein